MLPLSPSSDFSFTALNIEVGVGVTWLMKRLWEKHCVSDQAPLLSRISMHRAPIWPNLGMQALLLQETCNQPAGLHCLWVTLGRCH